MRNAPRQGDLLFALNRLAARKEPHPAATKPKASKRTPANEPKATDQGDPSKKPEAKASNEAEGEKGGSGGAAPLAGVWGLAPQNTPKRPAKRAEGE
jgi:hypothetical protein